VTRAGGLRPIFLALAVLVCAGAPAARAADPEVRTVVDSVIGSAHHPELKWPDISDVVPTLREVYAAEADGLFWFSWTRPDPSLPAVVRGLALADEQGLGRANFDADRLAAQWKEVSAGATPSQRALFDLAVSVNVARLVSAVNRGRVDPATVHWGYDMSPRTLDRAKGKVKEGAGKVTGDKRMESEGKADRAKGEVKDDAHQAKESAKGVRDSLKKD